MTGSEAVVSEFNEAKKKTIVKGWRLSKELKLYFRTAPSDMTASVYYEQDPKTKYTAVLCSVAPTTSILAYDKERENMVYASEPTDRQMIN